jgi:hypothetical protein
MLGYYFGVLAPASAAVRAQHDAVRGEADYSDLYMVWRGTRAFLFERQDPYALPITREIQSAIYGRPLATEYGAFVYPAPVAFIFAPFAAVPFAVAKWAFLAVAMAATAASLLCWMRVTCCSLGRSDNGAALVLMLTSYPALEAFYLQQPGALVAALIALAMNAAPA